MDVVVIGSCVMDFICYVDKLPQPGETIRGHTFSQGFGGKGANQCVMAARLGARCAMVAKVGDDTFGHRTIKNFQDNGINTEFVWTTSANTTDMASITVNERGENTIVIVGEAGRSFQPEEVGGARDLVAQAKVVICQLEILPQTTLAALKMAKELGVITILNVAPGLQGLDMELFESADVICLNETEAAMVTGLPVTDVTTATESVKALQETGTRCVVLTLGEKGLLYTQLVMGKWTPILHIAAEKVDVVDTTGAGDAFVGALAGYLAMNPRALAAEDAISLGDLLVRAGRVASHSVTTKGTQSSFTVSSLDKDLLIHPN